VERGEGASDGHQALLDLATQVLLDGERRYTAIEVCEQAGVDHATADTYWRAMGFPDVPDDEVAFTERDVTALRAAARLTATGFADDAVLRGQTRVMSQAVATIAAAQLEITDGPDALGGLAEFVTTVLPQLDDLLVYLYRRHLLAAVEQAILLDPGGAGGPTLAVGFADLVGFTRLANRVEEDELAALVEGFNGRAADVVAEGAGRVVKMLGDEVMFSSPDPEAATRTALRLVAEVGDHEGIPPLRAGVACGPVVLRHGDVFGTPVNLAHRLVDVARPGTVVVDEGVREAVARSDDLEVVRLSSVGRLRGFERVRVWAVRHRA